MLKRIFMGIFMLWVTLHLTGCDFIQSLPIPFLHKDEEVTEEEGEEGEEPAEEHQALIDTRPTPLISSYRPISVKMPDGLKIEGTLYIPGISPYKAPIVSEETETPPEEATEGGGGAKAEDEAGDGEKKKAEPEKEAKPAATQYPLVILFHGLSGDRWEWQEYPRHLVNAGYAVLALDLRGHGDSVYQGKNLRVWRQFDRSDWDKMPADTRNVLKFIAKQPKFNMVNTHKVGVIGASIGANIGLNFSHMDSKDVKATVLLSPGLEYQGIKTQEIMKHFHIPVYLLASTEDAYAADSTEQLYKDALGRKKIKIFQDLGHGIDMLNNDPELGRDILDWMKQQLPPSGIVATEPAAEEPEAKEETKKPEEKPKAEEKPKDTKKPEAAKTEKATAPAKPKAVAKPKPQAAPAKAVQPVAAPKTETPAEVKPTPAPVTKPVSQPVARPVTPTPPPAAPAPVAPTPSVPLPGSPQ